jgi:hypothetical protein
MRRSRFALVLLMAMAVLVLPQAANAKGNEPLRIVAHSGKVGWIRGAAATAWWADYDTTHKGSCACDSAAAAAVFMSRLVHRWGSAFNHSDGSWPPAMLVQAGHTIPMLYYPAGGTAPPYLLAPGEIGRGGIQWDDWHVVTPRMQRLITAALRKGSVSAYTGSTVFPTDWAIGGGLAAVLLVGLIVGAWRSPDLPERLASRLGLPGFRLSP